MQQKPSSAAEYLFFGGYSNDAVSRAYYAMFYAARALLASHNLHPKGHKAGWVKTSHVR